MVNETQQTTHHVSAGARQMEFEQEARALLQALGFLSFFVSLVACNLNILLGSHVHVDQTNKQMCVCVFLLLILAQVLITKGTARFKLLNNTQTTTTAIM